MKTTNALAASMRRLLANLHPPSPPTAKESQQLLNILQSSFKSRLDEKHPSPASYDFWPKAHNSYGIPIHNESTSSYATNVHLDSILANPVLGSLNDLHSKEDVISKFDKLIAEPSIDVNRMVGLVRWYTREMKAGKLQQHGERVGDRLNSWLHVTDRSSREAFLLDPSARAAALDLFACEGNEEVAWIWLRLIYERRLVNSDLNSPVWLDIEDYFVSGLMRLSIRRGNIAEAAQQFLEACRYRLDSGRGLPTRPLGQAASNGAHKMLGNAGMRLASAIIFHRQNHGIDSVSFTQVQQYLPQWHMSPSLNYAFCAIYSPGEPTAIPLCHHLRTEKGASHLIKHLATSTTHSRKFMVTALLDGSKVALDENKRSSAKLLLDFAIDTFPEYLPASQSQPLEDELERYLELIPG